MRRLLPALLFCALCVCPSLNDAAEPETTWGRFRGDNAVGYVGDCQVTLPWDESAVSWTVDLPGKGNGSPVLFGNRLFVMSGDPESAERFLLAIDFKTGKELWRKSFSSSTYRFHKRSSYASSTPCVDAERVYFTWATPDEVSMMAVTHDGEEVWSLGKEQLGPFVSQHGYGASPTIIGDKLLLFNSQQADQLPPEATPGQSRVMAFEPATGKLIWETPRTATRACYGAATYYRDLMGRELVLFANTGDGIFALDLSNGEPVWNNKVFGKRSVSCPIVTHGLAIGTEGSGGGGNVLWAVDLEGEHEVKFSIKRAAPYVPTPVVKDNLLFLWGDTGIVSCVQLPTGETLWSKRIGGSVSSSPVIAGDHLVGIAEDGTLTVLKAAAEFENLGSIALNDTTRATPLVTKDSIVIRTDSKLIRVCGE
ncbi:MAG: PQQ-binding-like beta-propeller repeat protein [Pirellulaceae bacterium]